MNTLHLDFETFSDVDLTKRGLAVYCESAWTGVWCLAWRLLDEKHRVIEQGVWVKSGYLSQTAIGHIAAGGRVCAHNAPFEFAIWNRVFRPRYCPDLPPLRLEQMDCTMARAAACGWPLDLDRLTRALSSAGAQAVPQKDMEGHALMLRVCKPKFTREDGVPVFHDPLDFLDRLCSYCDRDVDAEIVVDMLLPPLSVEEKRVWIMDQTINTRGVACDTKLIQRGKDASSALTKHADERMWWLTDGAVEKVSQVQRLIKWVQARGIECESLGKGDIEDVIAGANIACDSTALEAIELRRAAARASAAKFTKMQNTCAADGRLRGALQYHGAHTGRWAGRLWQPQNFPRVFEDDQEDVERAMSLLGSLAQASEIRIAFELMFKKPFSTLSKCLRPMLIAGPGTRFVGGDYSNIEGRLSATLACESWKMQAFRDFDEGRGDDLYKLAYAKSFGVAVREVSKPQRLVGKVQELSLQYQGSIGAFLSMGANYGIDPAAIALLARSAVGEVEFARVWETFDGARSYGLDQSIWTGIKIVVNGWRAAHPATVQSWWDEQDAAIAAMMQPGTPVPCLENKVTYLYASGYLFCRLPSGRVISYVNPRVEERRETYKKTDGTKGERLKRTVYFWALDGVTKQWKEHSLYGGLQHNNIVQGTARDILVEGLFRAEESGFTTVLTVHDELLTEVPIDSPLQADDLKSIMSIPPAYLPDMPIAASCWQGERYLK